MDQNEKSILRYRTLAYELLYEEGRFIMFYHYFNYHFLCVTFFPEMHELHSMDPRTPNHNPRNGPEKHTDMRSFKEQ